VAQIRRPVCADNKVYKALFDLGAARLTERPRTRRESFGSCRVDKGTVAESCLASIGELWDIAPDVQGEHAKHRLCEQRSRSRPVIGSLCERIVARRDEASTPVRGLSRGSNVALCSRAAATHRLRCRSAARSNWSRRRAT